MFKPLHFISIQVPGLAENRPSLTIGDRVLVTLASNDSSEYEGFVHIIERDKVFLKFSRG